MSGEKRENEVYSIKASIYSDSLAEVYTAAIDLDRFDYGRLYSYSQVSGESHAERVVNAERFYERLSEKKLDNQTVRTILETQNATLPGADALLIKGGKLADRKYFADNFRSMLYLDHAGFISMYDAWMDDDLPCCIIEPFAGCTTTEHVVATSSREAKLGLMRQIVNSVKLLHDNGMVHGDLRPENMIAFSGEDSSISAKLLTTGIIPSIEKALDGKSGNDSVSLFAYAAPEYYASSARTVSTDVYSLGACLFFFFTGIRPYDGSGSLLEMMECAKKGQSAFADKNLEKLDEPLRKVILKAVALSVGERYASADELLGDIIALEENRLPSVIDSEKENSSDDEDKSREVSDALANEIDDTVIPDVDTSNIKNEPSITSEHVSPKENIPDVRMMEAGMESTGRKIWHKIALVAVVFLVFVIGGFWLGGSGEKSSNDDGVSEQSAPSEEKPAEAISAENTESKEKTAAEAAKAKEGAVAVKAANEQNNRYRILIDDGNAAMLAKKYQQAASLFEQADKLNPGPEAKGLLQAAQHKEKQLLQRNEYLAKAGRFLTAKNLDAAEGEALKALNIPGYADDYQVRDMLKKIRQAKFDVAVIEGEKHLAGQKWHEAEMSFAWALSIDGHAGDEKALAGRQKAQEAMAREEQERMAKKREEAARKARYDAAMKEAEKLVGEKRWKEAAEVYSMALAVNGYENDTAAKDGRTKALQAAENSAREVLEKRQGKLKRQYEALLKSGQIYLEAGRWAEAEQAFSKALGVEGYAGSAEAVEGRKKAIAGSAEGGRQDKYDAFLAEGMAAIRSRDYAAAEKKFRDSLKVEGFERGELGRQCVMFAETLGKKESKRKEYDDYIKNAKRFIGNGDFAAAAQEFGRASVMLKNPAILLLKRGMAYDMAGDKEAALESFDQALKNDPALRVALAARGCALNSQEDYPQALEIFERIAAESKDPKEKAWGISAAGWVYYDGGWGYPKHRGVRPDNEKAAMLFEEADGLGSANGTNNLAVCYMKGRGVRRDYEKALPLFEKAADMGVGQALFNLGLAYYKGNGADRDYGKAVEYFKKASDKGFKRASGRLADMYQRGRGVERDQEAAQRYLALNGGNTDRDDDYELVNPESFEVVSKIAEPQFPVASKNELADQFDAIMGVAKKLMDKGKFIPAARTFELATRIEGFEENSFARAGMEEAKRRQADLEALAVTPDVSETPEEPKTAEKGKVDTAKKQIDAAEMAARLAQEKTSSPKAVSTEETREYRPYYDKVMAEANKMLARRNWGVAEQCFRLALALPGNLDNGGALNGLKSSLAEKKKAISAGSAKYTDFEAVVRNANDLLRDRQWAAAEYMFKYALSLEGYGKEPVALIGLEAATKAKKSQEDRELQKRAKEIAVQKGSLRDMATYNLAMTQAKQFLAENKYDPAIQMLNNILSWSDFENDPSALALLETAKKAKLESENSPEALQLKREKNRDVYEQLMFTGKVHLQNKKWEDAEKVYLLALKLGGYAEDAQANRGLDAAKKHVALQDIPDAGNGDTAVADPQTRAQFLALIAEVKKALDAKDYVRAEETARLALELKGCSSDPEGIALLDAACKAQGKEASVNGGNNGDEKDSSNLTKGFVTSDFELELASRKAQYDALMREGKRNLEAMQYDVAEATFLEVVKIKGYESDPEATQLLEKSRQLKPKLKPVEAPEPVKVDPRNDNIAQANLLLNEGNRLRGAGKLEAALQAYTSGVDLDPGNPKLLVSRADTRAALGRFDLALSDYKKALSSGGIAPDLRAYSFNNMANVYYHGKKEYSTAFDYYNKAAEGGNAAAMNSLGVCYFYGKGVPEDRVKALQWYKEAAIKGYGNSMLNLGMSYENGWNVQVDHKEALKWYEKAAEQNIPRAYIRLYRMYNEGLGTDKNPEKAEEYKKKARELGYNKDR